MSYSVALGLAVLGLVAVLVASLWAVDGIERNARRRRRASIARHPSTAMDRAARAFLEGEWQRPRKWDGPR